MSVCLCLGARESRWKELVLAPGLTLILSTQFSKRSSATPEEAEGHPFVEGRLTLYKQVSEGRRKG